MHNVQHRKKQRNNLVKSSHGQPQIIHFSGPMAVMPSWWPTGDDFNPFNSQANLFANTQQQIDQSFSQDLLTAASLFEQEVQPANISNNNDLIAWLESSLQEPSQPCEPTQPVTNATNQETNLRSEMTINQPVPSETQICEMIAGLCQQASTLNTPVDQVNIVDNEKKEMNHMYRIIDEELRDVQSSLGLTWSTLSQQPTMNPDSHTAISTIDTSSCQMSQQQSEQICLYQDDFSQFCNEVINHQETNPFQTSTTTSTPILRETNNNNFDHSFTRELIFEEHQPINEQFSNTVHFQINQNDKKKRKKQPIKQPFECSENSTANFGVKRIEKKRNNNSNHVNYRVRFGHNLFEEIMFKKSNPNSKFIIFK